MSSSWLGDSEQCTVIARTGGDIVGFGPYVASINDDGWVAWQASLVDGGSKVFVSDGGEPICWASAEDAEDAQITEIYSHPDINAVGDLSFYARFRDGREGLGYRGAQEGAISFADGGMEAIGAVGPLGPTMNDQGEVAFRGTNLAGEAGIYRMDGAKRISCIASIRTKGGQTTNHSAGDLPRRGRPSERADGTGVLDEDDAKGFSGFYGLPVIDPTGRVIFRAERWDGIQGIYSGDGDGVAAIVETERTYLVEEMTLVTAAGRAYSVEEVAPIAETERAYRVEGMTPIAEKEVTFSVLGFFPCVDGMGKVCFWAKDQRGGMGIFVAAEGKITRCLAFDEGWESCRGALRNMLGTLVFYATPQGGSLGVYVLHGGDVERIVCLGDVFEGESITEFALNPVSLNDRDQLVIRIADKRQREAILRVELGA